MHLHVDHLKYERNKMRSLCVLPTDEVCGVFWEKVHQFMNNAPAIQLLNIFLQVWLLWSFISPCFSMNLITRVARVVQWSRPWTLKSEVVCRIRLLFLFFLLCSRWAFIWFIVISVFSWATLCFIHFRSFRETLHDLSLSHHARRFKFYVASAIACVKIFAYFVKRFSQSILIVTTLRYYFIVLPSGTEFSGVFGVFHLRSHNRRKLHFYFLFVSSTFSLLCISVNHNFHSRFIVHFSFSGTYYVAQQLGNKEDL